MAAAVAHVGWPDFGIPEEKTAIMTALRSLLARARTGQRVEVGCLGGHGRTGTAVACLAVLTGCPAGEAVAWVREHYCTSTVETPEQEAFVTQSALT
jgi:protein-tyrosine phosphatase